MRLRSRPTPEGQMRTRKRRARITQMLLVFTLLASSLSATALPAPASAQAGGNCGRLLPAQKMTIDLFDRLHHPDSDRLLQEEKVTHIDVAYQPCTPNGKPTINGVIQNLTHYHTGVQRTNGGSKWKISAEGSNRTIVAYISKMTDNALTIDIAHCKKSSRNAAVKEGLLFLKIPKAGYVGGVSKGVVRDIIPEDKTWCHKPIQAPSIKLHLNSRGFFDRTSQVVTRAKSSDEKQYSGTLKLRAELYPASRGEHLTGSTPLLVGPNPSISGGAWFIESEGRKQWVDLRCAKANQRFYQYRSSEFLDQYSKFKPYPKQGVLAVADCDYLTERLDPRPNEARLFKAAGEPADHAWFVYKGERQWLNGRCMRQLVKGGNDPVEKGFAMIGANNLFVDRAPGYKYSNYWTCEEIQLKLTPYDGYGLYSSQGVGILEGWAVINGRSHYVSGECYQTYIRAGVYRQTIPYDKIEPLPDGPSNSNCSGRAGILKRRQK